MKDGVLTGSVAGRNGDTPISDATFKDDAIAFTVTRTFGDNTIKMTYTGKLDGDTITGTFDRPNPDGGDPVKADLEGHPGEGRSARQLGIIEVDTDLFLDRRPQ